MFYCSLVEFVLTNCIVCWFVSFILKNSGKLNSIVTRGGKVVGVRQT